LGNKVHLQLNHILEGVVPIFAYRHNALCHFLSRLHGRGLLSLVLEYRQTHFDVAAQLIFSRQLIAFHLSRERPNHSTLDTSVRPDFSRATGPLARTRTRRRQYARSGSGTCSALTGEGGRDIWWQMVLDHREQLGAGRSSHK